MEDSYCCKLIGILGCRQAGILPCWGFLTKNVSWTGKKVMLLKQASNKMKEERISYSCKIFTTLRDRWNKAEKETFCILKISTFSVYYPWVFFFFTTLTIQGRPSLKTVQQHFCLNSWSFKWGSRPHCLRYSTLKGTYKRTEPAETRAKFSSYPSFKLLQLLCFSTVTFSFYNCKGKWAHINQHSSNVNWITPRNTSGVLS